MARGDLRKPIRKREYIQSNEELAAKDQFTEAEADHSFKVEAAHAADDYSVQGDVDLSDKELLKRFRESLTSNILPTLPKIEGYHLCWVPQTSNNQYDTVEFRKRLGYAIVKPEEAPAYLTQSNRSGQFEGCISFNEMILMKIPERFYQLLMKEYHHTQPNEQELSIKQNIKRMEYKDGESVVRDEQEMDGINKLARKVKDPTF